MGDVGPEHVARDGPALGCGGLLVLDAHDAVPYFFSDLSDWASLEYLGPALSWDDEQVEGSVDDGAFAIWYREGDRVRAMLSVGGAGDLDRARELING